MARRKHPKPEIEAALRYAEQHGWRVEPGGSHAWGRMYCPYNSPDCRCGKFCIASIWSTPQDATDHARRLIRIIDHCSERPKP